jgi:GT2 family glycosyltransferase
MISVSIVSHRQGHLVRQILRDLSRVLQAAPAEVFLTLNVAEDLPFGAADFEMPLTVIRNPRPRGFGANHNAAFRKAAGEWFCVMNPDIRIAQDPFPVLVEEISARAGAVIAPAVLSMDGRLEDSIRHFPTPLSLARKLAGMDDGRYPFQLGDETFAADWVAGMCMFFRSESFASVGGFDEEFFLYYEDVELCWRLGWAGQPVLACPKAQVLHDARRASRRDLRHMRWHARSMMRYLRKCALRPPKTVRLS